MKNKINGLLDVMVSHRAEEAIDEITDILQRLQKRNGALEQENEQLKSEHYKDEEIARLNDRIKQLEEESLYGYPITKERRNKIMEIQTKHEREKHDRKGIGYFNYCFEDTSIGTFGWAECCDCGEKIMFLEAGTWIFG